MHHPPIVGSKHYEGRVTVGILNQYLLSEGSRLEGSVIY